MKKILYSIILLFVLVANVVAQVPRVISYQGVLVGADGKPVNQSGATVKISFYNAESGGSALSSTSYPVNIVGGLFSTIVTIPPASAMDLNQQLWLEVEYSNIRYKRVQLAASLYALNIADNVVTEQKIAEGAVTTSKIAPNAVSTMNIASNSIELKHLIDKTITSAKLANDAAVLSLNGKKNAVTLLGKQGITIQQTTNDNTLSIALPNGVDDNRLLRWNSANERWEAKSLIFGNEFVGSGNLDSPISLISGNAPGQVLKWSGNAWIPGQDETQTGVNNGLTSIAVIPPLLGTGIVANPLSIQAGTRDKQVMQWNSVANRWNIQDLTFDSLSIVKFWRVETFSDQTRPQYNHTYIGGYRRGGLFQGGALITFDAIGKHRDSTFFRSSKAGILGEGIMYSKSFELKDSVDGTAKAGIRFDSQGRAEVWSSGIKPFIVRDPTNPNRQIKYTAIEGPEAGMYCRGKIHLINGKAIIMLPEHFKTLAVDESITVQLTPHSVNSMGLAVHIITKNSVEIGELQKGQGNYEVSYFIAAIRKGFENYEVYTDEAKIPEIIPTQNIKHNQMEEKP